MTIDRIDDTRLLISLTEEDLQSFGLRFDQILWSDSRTKVVIRSLLALAKAETGFSVESHRVMIEVIPKLEGCLILFTLLDKRERERKKYKIKSMGEPFIYIFETAEDLLSALERIYAISSHIEDSKLLEYKNRYYLVLYTKSGLIPSVSVILSEYGNKAGCGKVAAAKIAEYGTVVAEHRAIETIGLYLK